MPLPELETIEREPWFIKAPYEDQVHLRSAWADAFLEEMDQRGVPISLPEREEFQRLAITLPPVFEGTLSDYGKRRMDLIHTIRKDTTEGAIAAGVLLGVESFVGASGILKWFLHRIEDVGESIVELFGANPNKEEYLFDVAKPKTQDDIKASQYFLKTLMDHPGVKTLASVGEFIGFGAAKITDIVLVDMITSPILGPLLTSLYGTAHAKLIATALSKSNFGRWVINSAVPVALRNTKEAAFGVVSDYLSLKYEDPRNLPDSFLQTVGWAVSTGFNYVLWDMVVFGGWSLLKTATKSIMKTIKGMPTTAKSVEQALRNVEDIDSWRKLVDSFLTDSDIDPALFSQYPDQVRATYAKLQANFNVLRRMRETGTPPTLEELDRMIALSKGYLMNVEPGKVTLEATLDGLPKIEGTFADTVSAIKELYKKLNIQPGVDTVSRAPVVRLTKELEKEVPYNARVLLATELLSNLKIGGLPGVVATDMKSLEAFRERLSSWLAEAGKKAKIQIVDGSKYLSFESQNIIKASTDTIFIPDKVTNVQEFLRVMGLNLSNVLGEDRKAIRAVLGALADMNIPKYDPDVIEMMVRRKYPTATVRMNEKAGEFVINLGDNQTLKFSSLNDMGRFLLKETPTSDQLIVLKNYLKNHLGMELKETKTGGFVIKAKGHIITEVSSPDQLFAVLYERNWIPGLPSEWAPQAIITPMTKEKGGEIVAMVQMEAPIVVGTPDFVLNKMNKFEDLTNKIVKKRLGIYLDGKINLNELTKGYAIELLDTGVSMRFATLEEAKGFLSTIKTKSDLLELTANLKGFYVQGHSGQWILVDTYGRVDKPMTFSKADDALAYLKGMSTPKEIGKELTALDDAFIKYLYRGNEDLLQAIEGLRPTYTNAFDEFKLEAAIINKVKETQPIGSPSTTFSALFAPMDVFAQKASKVLELPEVYTKYREFAKAANLMEAHIMKANAILSSLFKGFSAKDLRNMLLLFGVEEGLWAKKAVELGINLTDEMTQAMKKLRVFYERMGKVFGIDMTILHKNFLPRAQEFIHDPKRLAKYGEADAAIRALASEFPEYTPRELEFFAKNMRVKDMVTFVETADIVSVTQKYIRQGYKNMILDPVYQDLRKLVNEVMKNKDLMYTQRFVRFMEHVIGSDIDLEGAFLKKGSLEASTKIFQELGKRLKSEGMSKKQIEDLLSAMNALMVSATMAFRPVLVVRNLTQNLTNLSTRLGITPVVRAYKKAVTLEGERIAKILSDMGETLQQSPFLNMYDVQYPLKKLTQKGMLPYQNADHLNRVITYLAAEEVFDDAVKKWMTVDAKTGKRLIDEKQFMGLSGLRIMDDADKRNILSLLKEKGPEAAKLEFASKLIYETQFPYKSAENPLMFHGLWGRLFGAFGTYPLFYVTNITRGIKNAGPIGALQFLTRSAVVTATLYTAFEKILGIPATSVTPWGQATFDGGPFFKLFTRSLTALKPGWEGEMARKGLLEEWARILTPGSTQFLGIKRAFEAADRGDFYEAFVRLTGSSYVGND